MLSQIRPGPTNPRKTFDPAAMAELTESVRRDGVLQNLVVRPVAGPGNEAAIAAGRWNEVTAFEIVAGERRYRAAGRAGLTHVPVLIRVMTDVEVLEVQLVENSQRVDVPPSEETAAYARLAAAGRTAGQIGGAVGKPVGYVRGLLRLAKLPAWALAAVDRGDLPRATAELVARVPGEESRRKAAACVLLGFQDPRDLLSVHRDAFDADYTPQMMSSRDALSYRDTRDLIRNHFTQELKGCPFSRTALYVVPGETRESGGNASGLIEACDPCPRRAGNDPEATADGVRADVCLDPDCYRAKVEAFQAAELARAVDKGVLDADLGVSGFLHPPKGWCDLNMVVWMTDLKADFPVGFNQDPKREEKLGKVLGKACPQRYIAFGRGGKPVFLVKTGEARRALQDLGVLKKEKKTGGEKRRESQRFAPGPRPAAKPAGPPAWQVCDQAVLAAAKVLGEYGEEQFAALNDFPDAASGGTASGLDVGPISRALRLVAHAVAYDRLCLGGRSALFLTLQFPDTGGSPRTRKDDGDRLNEVVTWSAARCLAFLLQHACDLELGPGDGPNTETAKEILDFAELDWGQLRDQARRGLSPETKSPDLGEQPADEKLAAAGKEQEANPTPPPKSPIEALVDQACGVATKPAKKAGKAKVKS